MLNNATSARFLTFPFTDPYRNTGYIAGKGNIYDATIDTVGVYIEDTVHLSDQWIVNGGVRLDDFERDQVGGPESPVIQRPTSRPTRRRSTPIFGAGTAASSTSRSPSRASTPPTPPPRARSAASSTPPASSTTGSAPLSSTRRRKRRAAWSSAPSGAVRQAVAGDSSDIPDRRRPRANQR
ncbi:MAG: TonB-dependent receptor [Hyphomicrobium sp.]